MFVAALYMPVNCEQAMCTIQIALGDINIGKQGNQFPCVSSRSAKRLYLLHCLSMVPLFVESPYVIKAHLLSVQELNALAYVECLGSNSWAFPER